MAALLAHSPHRPTQDFHSGFSSESMSGGVDAVHVAVGMSMEKTMSLLQWTVSNFPRHEIVLLHVHRPSPFIPTPLGRLPASRANPEMLEAFRHEEREKTTNVLSTYLTTCSRSRVKARIITTETDEVHKGIVDLVNLHTIRKLAVGATPDFMKGKRSSCKASYVAEQAPSYCEMWFVNKRKLIWTRPASPSASICLPSCHIANPFSHGLEPWSLNSGQNKFLNSTCDPLDSRSASLKADVSSGNEYAAPRLSSASRAKTIEECLRIQLAELKQGADESRDEANQNLVGRKISEDRALEAFNKVKAMEAAHSREEKLRIDAEEALRTTIQGQEKLLEESEKISQQMQMTTRNIALLDSRAQEANRRCEEVFEELQLIEAFISTLRNEKQKLQGKKNEATRWLDRWKNHEKCEDTNESIDLGSKEDSCEVPEMLVSDVEAATCDFCESLRIGHGEYGTVYKGEMSGKTVAIKKLHGYNMERHAEFKSTAQVLGKLRHPHLVKLIGVCLESWSLIYEYMPGGSLQNYLYNKRNISALNWKTRAQIVADIASGLQFLHSSKSKKIVHGNLKPENLFLDSRNRCKISDYGDNTLIPSQALHSCSAPSGFSLYTDLECYKTGTITHKSDIYSFGVIILQLVTGKTKRKIVSKVRRAMLMGKTASILDLSAGDWSTYVGRRLLELGLQCCGPNSKDRPEISLSLVRELECMPFLEEKTVPSFFLCPILREIMHDPQVAADGFTYERDALRGWLGSGHETSPMTNLKLSHLDLTPNYSLRVAIQDWVSNLEIASSMKTM